MKKAFPLVLVIGLFGASQALALPPGSEPPKAAPQPAAKAIGKPAIVAIKAQLKSARLCNRENFHDSIREALASETFKEIREITKGFEAREHGKAGGAATCSPNAPCCGEGLKTMLAQLYVTDDEVQALRKRTHLLKGELPKICDDYLYARALMLIDSQAAKDWTRIAAEARAAGDDPSTAKTSALDSIKSAQAAMPRVKKLAHQCGTAINQLQKSANSVSETRAKPGDSGVGTPGDSNVGPRGAHLD